MSESVAQACRRAACAAAGGAMSPSCSSGRCADRDVKGRRRLSGHQRAAFQEPAQARGGESARGAELALVESPGLVHELQRRALARAQPGRRLRAPAQRAPGRRDTDDVHAVGHAQPALAPVPLRVRGERAGLEPDPIQIAKPALPRLGGRGAGVRERVPAFDLERARGRAHERQRGRERREVVLLDAARDAEELLGDGRNAQDVPQRQDAPFVRRLLADLEDDPDDRLGAQGDGDEGAGQRAGGQLAGDLVVEGLGEGPGADERKDGGVAHKRRSGLMERGSAGSPLGRRRLPGAAAQALRPAAARSTSALSVRSHVKSWSLRPK